MIHPGILYDREEPFFSKFEKLMEVTDLVMLDIKEMDAKRHRELTGQDNANILEMARYLSDHGKVMWIRHVLVPGVTDQEEDLLALRDFVASKNGRPCGNIATSHTPWRIQMEGTGRSLRSGR